MLWFHFPQFMYAPNTRVSVVESASDEGRRLLFVLAAELEHVISIISFLLLLFFCKLSVSCELLEDMTF